MLPCVTTAITKSRFAVSLHTQEGCGGRFSASEGHLSTLDETEPGWPNGTPAEPATKGSRTQRDQAPIKPTGRVEVRMHWTPMRPRTVVQRVLALVGAWIDLDWEQLWRNWMESAAPLNLPRRSICQPQSIELW